MQNIRTGRDLPFFTRYGLGSQVVSDTWGLATRIAVAAKTAVSPSVCYAEFIGIGETWHGRDLGCAEQICILHTADSIIVVRMEIPGMGPADWTRTTPNKSLDLLNKVRQRHSVTIIRHFLKTKITPLLTTRRTMQRFLH
jgi:hypothetical protein